MGGTRIALAVALLAAAGAACLAAGRHAALAYEALLLERGEAALAAVGLGWAELGADGTRLALSGRAPDTLARDLALETLALAAPAAAVADATEVAPPRAVPRPAPAVEIHREGPSLLFLGTLPDAEAARALVARFADRAPDFRIEDLIAEGAAAPETPLPAALAVEAVLSLPRARARLEPGLLRLTGLARSEEARRAVTARLIGVAPADAMVEIDLRVPPPVIAPFMVSVAKIGGALRLERCAARDGAEAARLGQSLARAGLRDSDRGCEVGAGGPPGDWPGAVAAGLAALDTVPAGRFALDYRIALLRLPGDVSEAEAGAAEAVLAAALPAGFRLRVERSAAAAEADAPPESALSGYWLSLAATPDSVSLGGRMPGGVAARALETVAAARFPGRVARAALSPHPDAPPEGWGKAAEAALEALARLGRGRARLLPGRLMLEGPIPEPARAREIQEALAAAAPGYAVETRLRVDLPARIAALDLTAGRCVVLLNRLMAAEPLAFAPGSAVLEPPTGPTLDRAAEILARCPEARLEIGGHTDSQGSEGFNERLSRARADAVRAALVARGAGLARLTARGYGEARPIASNATDAGRARNRRIAFSAAPEAGG